MPWPLPRSSDQPPRVQNLFLGSKLALLQFHSISLCPYCLSSEGRDWHLPLLLLDYFVDCGWGHFSAFSKLNKPSDLSSFLFVLPLRPFTILCSGYVGANVQSPKPSLNCKTFLVWSVCVFLYLSAWNSFYSSCFKTFFIISGVCSSTRFFPYGSWPIELGKLAEHARNKIRTLMQQYIFSIWTDHPHLVE